MNAKISVLLLLAAQVSWAAETASFLDVGVGARGLGMGGAYTALGDDANALYWNPAGLAALDKREVSAGHVELSQSIRHDSLAYAHPTPQGTFAAGAIYLSQSSLDGRDAAGHPTGGFRASDAALSFGWGRKTELADFGASVKYLRSHIGSAEAQTFALDAGVRKTAGAAVLGAALRNVGPGLKYDRERNDLPLRLALGAAFKFSGGHSVATEIVNGPRGAGTDAGFGGEYRAIKNVFLRAGYSTQTAITGGSGFDAVRGLSLGAGYRDGRWSLDYAVAPMGELGNVQRLSLATRF